MAINQLKLLWATIFTLSVSILILRIIDFADEAVHLNFHISRIGLNISGFDAFLIQIAIILSSTLLMLKSREQLAALRLFCKPNNQIDTQ